MAFFTTTASGKDIYQKIEIKDYNLMADGRNSFDQLVKKSSTLRE